MRKEIEIYLRANWNIKKNKEMIAELNIPIHVFYKYIAQLNLKKGKGRTILANLAGKTFGDLDVIEEVGRKSYGEKIYKCQCKCGNIVHFDRQQLTRNYHPCCDTCDENNLIGQKFGRWTVIQKTYAQSSNNKRKGKRWVCRCECGNIKNLFSGEIKSGASKSCGCYKLDSQLIDITGQKFGKWTVLRKDPSCKARGKASNMYWLCQCECGNVSSLCGTSLRVGDTFKCKGCANSKANNPMWKGGITDEYNIIRHTKEQKDWTRNIKMRDNYTCQCCGERSINKKGVVAHHIFSFSDNEDKRSDINNGITLCASCHREFHDLYGSGGNNKLQLTEFILLIRNHLLIVYGQLPSFPK